MVPLLAVAEQGRDWGWGSPRSLTAYAVGAVGLLGFFMAERAMGDAALIPLRIFRIRAAAVTIAASVIVGVATSSATFFRQIGGTLGVAIFLSVLSSSVGGNIADAIAHDATTPAWQQAVAEGHGPTPELVAQVQDDSSVIEQMDPVIAHPFKVGFAESMDLVFLSTAGVGVDGP